MFENFVTKLYEMKIGSTNCTLKLYLIFGRFKIFILWLVGLQRVIMINLRNKFHFDKNKFKLKHIVRS